MAQPKIKTPPHPLFLLAAAFYIFTYAFSEGAVAAKDKPASDEVEAVADQLALDQYEIYHQNRLTREAEQEAFEDDKVLKVIESKIGEKRKGK